MSNENSSEKVKQQVGIVPKLRFPEFRNAPKWQNMPLSKVLRPISREVAKPTSRYIGLGLRSHGKGTFQKPCQDPEEIQMDRLFEVRGGDLIVNITFAWEGAISIANDEDDGCLVSHRFPTYEFNSDVSNPEFFRHLIIRKAFVYQLGVISPGGAGRNRVMNQKDFLKLPVILPSPNEQQKIANCLCSIDALILAEVQKLDALREHKKGLMQQVFPTDGESSPRLRFPALNNDGNWQEINLGATLDGAPSYGVNAPAVPYTQNLPTYLRITDISKDGQFLDEKKMSVEVEPKPDNTMQDGDIALVRTGASVGKSYIHEEKNGPLVFAGFLIRIRINQQKFCPRYIFQFLHSDRYWMWVEKTSKRSGQPGLNSSEYASLVVPLPGGSTIDSLDQQSKIADFLWSIDNQIESQSNVVSQLERHKAGLMQLLFPVFGVLES